VSALRQPARIAPHLLADALVFLALPIRANGAEPDVGDEKGPLEQVIVTAQFRRENLEQTPLSMTVVSADTLTRHNMTTLTDVGDVVPNVTLGPGGTGAGKSVLAFIRGVGTGDYQYTVEPGVAVYLDDVFLSGQFGNAFDLLDLDRVEVLRGPQGTLFGKNSIGGAILLTSRKPQGDGTGSLELTTGDFSRKEARGFFDVPLIRDELSLRLAAGSRQRDGYVDRLDYACVHPDLGGVVDPTAPFLLSSNRTAGHCSVGTGAGESIQSARASLRWHRNDALDAQLSVDWMNDHSGASAQALIAIDDSPGSPVNAGGFNLQVAVPIYGVPYDSRFLTGNLYQSYDTVQRIVHVGPSATIVPATVTGITSAPEKNAVETYGVTASIDAQLASSLHLKSITSYRGYSGVFSQDVGGAPISVAEQTNILDHQQFSEELRLVGQLGPDRLDWAAGLFYLDSYSLNRGPVTLSAYSWLDPSLDINQNDPSNIRDRAVFAQATWHASSKLNLTLGARYTHEHKDYRFRHTSFDPSVPDLVTDTPTQVDYGKTNGRVAIDYQWTSWLMTYVSASSAFRAGGFNGRPFNASQIVAFGPETLIAYEAGLKSEAFDRRLRVNIAAFLSRYKDLQLSVFELDAMGIPFSTTVNQGRAQITGTEIEVEARPLPPLTVSAAFGLNHYTNKDLGTAINCDRVANPVSTPAPGANCTQGGPLPGSPLPSLPERTASLAIEYELRFADGSIVRPRLDATFQSRIYFDAVGTPEAAVPGRTLLNGRLTWDIGHSPWEVALRTFD
jgi:iron complex outermembrane recepter protein